MGPLTIVALLFTLNTVINAQSQKILEDWGERASTRFNYYSNDTLNLVTLGLVNGKKYFFANQEASWFEANYFCNAHGMDLVSIESQHENDLILEHISKIGMPKYFVFWISGHKIGTSSWLWINGEFIIFSDWAIGEPSQPKTDFCLCIWEGKWYDLNCDFRASEAGFICEERESLVENNDAIAELRSIYPNEFLNLVTLDPTSGKQYLFANVSSTWFDANYFCNAHGMDLVTIETKEENDLLMAHIESIGMTKTMVYWTSAHKIGRSTWLWINGDNVIFSDWAPTEPSDPTTENCMHIYDSNWFDKSCKWIGDAYGKAAFICETRELPSGNGTEIVEGETYYPADMMNLVTLGPGNGKKYLVADQPASWFEASYFCNAHGMDLVTIETQEENDAIMNHLVTLGLGIYDYTLTSGHKIGRTTYLWINGEYMLYSDWASGSPSQEATENCMIICSNDWCDIPCNSTVSYFICEERIA